VRFVRQISIVFSTVLCLGAAAAPSQGQSTTAEAGLVQAVNAVRAQHGLAPLRLDARLERAARAHSQTVLRAGRLVHGNVRGRLSAYGVRSRAVGENLAWGVGSRATSAAVVQMWLASPPHRKNLLRPGFRRIGIGHSVGTFAGYGGANVFAANFAGR
jgi:uncharacterized protein YkwD